MSVYLDRYAWKDVLFKDPPRNDLAISVVIPCYNELRITKSLESLWGCNFSGYSVEVIVIVNEPHTSTEAVRIQSQKTLKELAQWSASYNKTRLRLLFAHSVLPDRHAGVGLARKIGMDEAARRFESINNTKGVICGFDADCTCAENYLTEVYKTFYHSHDGPVGTSIYFEHPLDNLDDDVSIHIAEYELHLRYYIHALRFANYPYSYQTVGSSMAVNTERYKAIGGMNIRKAGEDFHFLHRLMNGQKFVNLNTTTVFPSSRLSDRVPFGTGKAMIKHRGSNLEIMTYHNDIFNELKYFLSSIDELYQVDPKKTKEWISCFHEAVKDSLLEMDLEAHHARCLKNSRNHETWKKHMMSVLNGLFILKFVHYASDQFFPKLPVTQAAQILAIQCGSTGLEANVFELLEHYRNQDRHNSTTTSG